MTIFGARAACCAAGLAALLLSPASSAAPAAEILRWEPPFSYSSPATRQPYAAPAKARRAWKLCVVVPHLKDAYWLAVNYGMIDEARRLGVSMQVLEAGGYPNLARQRSLVQACAEAADMDAVILGTVSFDGLSDLLREVSRRKPVLATVNDIADAGLAAKVGVSWYDMGRQVGEYLAGLPAAGQARVPVAWFPGPRDAGWVPFVDKGFRDAIRDSPIAIVSTGWGDTDKTVQRDLVQEALDAHPEVRYLVGNAMMAEAAVGVLRERDSDGRPGGRLGGHRGAVHLLHPGRLSGHRARQDPGRAHRRAGAPGAAVGGSGGGAAGGAARRAAHGAGDPAGGSPQPAAHRPRRVDAAAHLHAPVPLPAALTGAAFSCRACRAGRWPRLPSCRPGNP